jgi:hypothetical protein
MELVIFCLDFAICFDGSNISVDVAAFQFPIVLAIIIAMNMTALRAMPFLK